MSLDDENLEREIKRGEAITKTAGTIIDQGRLTLDYQKHFSETLGDSIVEMPLIGLTDRATAEQNVSLKKRIKRLESYK